jgi:Meiotically up-regulated gene 113
MIETEQLSCEKFQRIAHAWLRSGEISRTNNALSPLEELAGFNYGFVYLLALDELTCKIGFSEHPMRRIREIRNTYRYGDRLKLKACFVGEQTLERELHKRFAHLRIENERFMWSHAIEVAFTQARERMRIRLNALHLCSPECPQLVCSLDLRMLHIWLKR